MRDFEERLADELRGIARTPSERTSKPIPPRFSRSPLAWLVPAACATLVLALVLSNDHNKSAHAAELPVLRRPAVDASALRARLERLRLAHVDFGTARAIDTPTGRGYVMTSPTDICLAIPDPPDSWGQTCAPRARADNDGISAQLTASRSSDGPSSLVLVLPANASTPVAHDGQGRPEHLVIETGVATGTFTTDSTVTYQVGAREIRIPVTGVEPQGPWSVGCADGRVVRVPDRQSTYGSARARACR